MARLKALKTDSNKERSGVWRTYPGTDARFKIARSSNNPAFEAASKRLRKSARRAIEGDMTETQARKAIAPAVAEFIVLSWEKLEDDETGKPTPYSKEAALRMLNDPEMSDWYGWVLLQAADGDLFRVDLDEEESGNSEVPSSG